MAADDEVQRRRAQRGRIKAKLRAAESLLAAERRAFAALCDDRAEERERLMGRIRDLERTGRSRDSRPTREAVATQALHDLEMRSAALAVRRSLARAAASEIVWAAAADVAGDVAAAVVRSRAGRAARRAGAPPAEVPDGIVRAVREAHAEPVSSIVARLALRRPS